MFHHNNQELLALEIANTLKDPDSYAQFLAFAYKHPEQILRRQLTKALTAPNIRNRAALFVSLVKNYEKTSSLPDRF